MNLHKLLIVGMLMLGACTKQGVVKAGLVNAGVPAPVASCMSKEMASRLSVDELRKLGHANTGDGKAIDQLTAADYVDRAQRIGDPKVVAVTAAAAAYCNLGR